MVLRKICNFAKIAPFQLNIFNVVKRLFYVIFIFVDIYTIKYNIQKICFKKLKLANLVHFRGRQSGKMDHLTLLGLSTSAGGDMRARSSDSGF